jgi:hypothetical protein
MDADSKKNLIYFIYYNGKLHHYHVLNLRLLSMFWSVFDGQKIIKIAVDADYNLAPIVDMLPKGCEYRIVKNVPQTGECIHFLESLVEVNGGMTFYGHCKGVTRPMWRGLDMWITHLYRKNLTDVPRLGDKIFSGVCGKLLPCPPYVPEPFHYSGSFYWFATDKVKERLKNKKIVMEKYVTERFPGIMAKEQECIFGFASSNKALNFYDERTWRTIR